jgi:hypothetical protein
MPRGPLPNPNARRRNAPTIPDTVLPASGRAGEAPGCPYDLARAGSAWWAWAWSTPQASKWDAGALYVVARRAVLEDELAALALFDADEFSLRDLLSGSDPEAVSRVEWAIGTLKRLASGSTGLMREMRELDNRLGLNPKAMADLRWTVAPVAAGLIRRGALERCPIGSGADASGCRERLMPWREPQLPGEFPTWAIRWRIGSRSGARSRTASWSASRSC